MRYQYELRTDQSITILVAVTAVDAGWKPEEVAATLVKLAGN
jgi:hypothetical protein